MDAWPRFAALAATVFLMTGCHDELGSHFKLGARSELFELAHDESDQGDISAHIYVGWAYVAGSGVVKDIDYAIWHLEKASRYGSPLAAALLNALRGSSPSTRLENCVAVVRRFTRSGNADAQMLTASWIMFGEGMSSNRSEAMRVFKIAADGGSSYSRTILKHLHGEGGYST